MKKDSSGKENLKKGNSEQEKIVKEVILERKNLKKDSSGNEKSEKGQFGKGTI